MSKLFHVKCPYCGVTQPQIHNTANIHETVIAYCDDEIGGCGKPFAIESHIEIAYTVYALMAVQSEATK